MLGGGFRGLGRGIRRVKRAVKKGASKARIVVKGPLVVIEFDGPVRSFNLNVDELRAFVEKLEEAALQTGGGS